MYADVVARIKGYVTSGNGKFKFIEPDIEIVEVHMDKGLEDALKEEGISDVYKQDKTLCFGTDSRAR